MIRFLKLLDSFWLNKVKILFKWFCSTNWIKNKFSNLWENLRRSRNKGRELVPESKLCRRVWRLWKEIQQFPNSCRISTLMMIEYIYCQYPNFSKNKTEIKITIFFSDQDTQSFDGAILENKVNYAQVVQNFWMLFDCLCEKIEIHLLMRIYTSTVNLEFYCPYCC